MKKKIASLAIVGMLFAGTTVFADPSVKLNFNGSIVNDPQAYIAGNSSAYVTVDTFAKYYGVK